MNFKIITINIMRCSKKCQINIAFAEQLAKLFAEFIGDGEFDVGMFAVKSGKDTGNVDIAKSRNDTEMDCPFFD